MCTPTFQRCGDLWHAHRANKSLLRPATGGGSEGGREHKIDGNTERPERLSDRKKDVACLPRRRQESSITARSRHSLSSLSILLYSVAVFFFVCLLSVQSRAPSASVLSPTLTPPPSLPPSQTTHPKKERQREGEFLWYSLSSQNNITAPEPGLHSLSQGLRATQRPSSMATRSWHDAKKRPEQ